MDLNDPKKKKMLEKLLACAKNGIELDKKGHALARISQRNIDFLTVSEYLNDPKRIIDIQEYKSGTEGEAYRVFLKITENKTLVVGVILKDICIIKTVFPRFRKYQNKVEKLWRNSK